MLTQVQLDWLNSDDTGISSKTIFHVLSGLPVISVLGKWHTDRPYDPSDFGRCYRLLKKIPEWRSRLSEVSDLYNTWKPLIDNWEELEKLYEEELPNNSCPKLYDLMHKLYK